MELSEAGVYIWRQAEPGQPGAGCSSPSGVKRVSNVGGMRCW